VAKDYIARALLYSVSCDVLESQIIIIIKFLAIFFFKHAFFVHLHNGADENFRGSLMHA
jgi:hypothetical protein